MTPELLIKKEMLLQSMKYDDTLKFGPLDIEDEVVDAWDSFVATNSHWDVISEFRGGEIETNIPSQFSRNYEAKEVARKMSNGVWVGWTYWYGGGKHGNPEEIEWMSDAYFLECKEEEKVVTVRTFTKV